MTVKITKPEINVREELNQLRKPSGTAGAAMLRAETPQEQFNLIGAGRRNLLINGGFDVWQRATSSTTSSGYRSVDRWAFNTYTGGAFTVSKETDSTFGNVLKWNRTTADTSHANAGNCIQQPIENAKYLVKGKSVTVSFWLKNEKTILRSGFVRFRITASPYTVLAPNQYWESASNAWEYHSFTFQTSETVNTDHVELQIQMDNGSSMGAMFIAQCQFEIGNVATPFEHRSYGEELALCQRYYQKLFDTNAGTYSHRWQGRIGSVYSTTRVFVTVDLPVEMRSVPTIVFETEGNGFRWNIYSAAADIGPSTSIANTYASRSSVGFDVAPVANMPSGYVGNACHMDVRDGWCHANAEL